MLCKRARINIIEYMRQLISTMMDARDKEYMARSKGDLQRSIDIWFLYYSQRYRSKNQNNRFYDYIGRKPNTFFKME